MASELYEKRLSSRHLYRGKILSLRVDDVELPSGKRTIREVVEHADAVAVLAESNDSLVLVEQYRYPVGSVMWEIPAGLVESGEDPLQTAVRELQEEIGFFPETIEEIARFYTSPGFSNEQLYVFHAKNLRHSKLEGDDDEKIQVISIPFEEVESVVNEGKIKDGKTLFALWWFLSKNPQWRNHGEEVR